MYLISGVCLLLVLGQGALSADEEGGGEGNNGCAPLAMKAVHLECLSPDGEKQDCKRPDVGTRVRVTWKKNILKNGKGVTNIVCNENGEWRRAPAPSPDAKKQSSGGKSSDSKPKTLQEKVVNKLSVTPPAVAKVPSPTAGGLLSQVPILNKIPLPPIPNIGLPSIPNIGLPSIPNIGIPTLPNLGLPTIPGIPLLGK